MGNGVKRLNIGCGFDIQPGWINLDMHPREGVHVVHDMAVMPMPFEDEEFDFIKAWHILEHLDSDHFIAAMKELHRILKPGGVLSIKVPEASCAAAIADPTHKMQFVPASFTHWGKHNMGPVTADIPEGLFHVEIIESIPQNRGPYDRGVPGSYFTEITAELIKPDPEREREIALRRAEILAIAAERGDEHVRPV